MVLQSMLPNPNPNPIWTLTDELSLTATLSPLEEMIIEVPDDLVSGTAPYNEWKDEI